MDITTGMLTNHRKRSDPEHAERPNKRHVRQNPRLLFLHQPVHLGRHHDLALGAVRPAPRRKSALPSSSPAQRPMVRDTWRSHRAQGMPTATRYDKTVQTELSLEWKKWVSTLFFLNYLLNTKLWVKTEWISNSKYTHIHAA